MIRSYQLLKILLAYTIPLIAYSNIIYLFEYFRIYISYIFSRLHHKIFRYAPLVNCIIMGTFDTLFENVAHSINISTHTQ